MKKCNLVEFFSGIGSQYKALKNLKVQVNTIGTSEWDVHAIAAYDIMHTSISIPDDIIDMEKDELLKMLSKYTFSNSGKTPLDYKSLKTYSKLALQRIYASIKNNRNYVDINQLDGSMLSSEIDILTYSFPCQDLSNVGAFHGYNKGIDKNSGSRSSLLWQVGRILTEMHESHIDLPRFLLMENVPTLLSKRHWPNFKTWIDDLESLGYYSKFFELNASSFGLPQNRPRLLMISVYIGSNKLVKKVVEEFFSVKSDDVIVQDYHDSKYFHEYHVSDFLRTDYNNPMLFKEAVECTPNDTVSRRKIWEENPQIINERNEFNESIESIRTITTKQDRNPNSGNLYFDSGIEGKSHFRYLTPRECLLFMGFTDEDYEKLVQNEIEFHKGDAFFSRDKIIRMAGNSIPVKLLEGVFLQIMQLDEVIEAVKEQEEKKHMYYDIDTLKKIVKSYLYSKGIRSILKGQNYPSNADIAYPKYFTAIYFKDYYFNKNNQFVNILSNLSRSSWERVFIKNDNSMDAKVREATDMGWNAIVIWKDQLMGENKESILEDIAELVKTGIGRDNQKGKVSFLGRY